MTKQGGNDMEDKTVQYLKLHIHVIEAKHLKSRDDSASSDPFVSVYVLDVNVQIRQLTKVQVVC